MSQSPLNDRRVIAKRSGLLTKPASGPDQGSMNDAIKLENRTKAGSGYGYPLKAAQLLQKFIFDPLRVKYPDKYIALIQPPDVDSGPLSTTPPVDREI
jgi:hypothetical protein